MLLGRNVHFSTVLKGSKEKSSVAALMCSTIDIAVWRRHEQGETERKGNIRAKMTEKEVI